MKSEQLAVVRGWADTRAALRGWRARPAATIGAVAGRQPRGRRAAAGRHLGRRDPEHARPDAVACSSASAASATGTTSSSSSTATRSCWRCTRWPASPASWPARRCRSSRRATAAGGGACTTAPGGSRSGSWPARRCSRSPRRPTRSARTRRRWPPSAASSPALLLVGLLPHALPELCALFLPLAAWILASRRGAWHELLAATFVTTAIAVPVLLASAAVEVWVTPHVLYFLK